MAASNFQLINWARAEDVSRRGIDIWNYGIILEYEIHQGIREGRGQFKHHLSS